MKSLRRLLGSPEAPILLFGIGLLLFAWPFLNDRISASLDHLFSFLFSGWLLLILGIALTGRAARQRDDSDREQR